MFRFDRKTLEESFEPEKMREFKTARVRRRSDPLEVQAIASSEPAVIRPAHFAEQAPIEGLVTDAEDL
jgi:hypothetical protein